MNISTSSREVDEFRKTLWDDQKAWLSINFFMRLLTKKKKNNYGTPTTRQALLWTQDTEVSNIAWWELGIHLRSFLECVQKVSVLPVADITVLS